MFTACITKRSFGVAKELGIHKRFWDGTTVDWNERLICAWTVAVNVVGQMPFAYPSFSGNQNGAVPLRSPLGFLQPQGSKRRIF